MTPNQCMQLLWETETGLGKSCPKVTKDTSNCEILASFKTVESDCQMISKIYFT